MESLYGSPLFKLLFMEDTMNIITSIIEDYNSSDNHPPEGLLNMGRSLASHLFFLEKHRSEAHKRFEAEVFRLKQQGSKVNAALNDAENKVPELYQLRRFMEAAYKVLEMIRSELSWLKAEMQNSNIHG